MQGGEEGGIRGKVTNTETGDALPFANIILEGTQRGATSRLDGTYSLSRIPAGVHRVTVSIVGFERMTREVTVTSTQTSLVDFAIPPVLTKITEVVITSTRPISAASSSFIRALDFELRPKQSSQDLLRMVPGLVIAQHAGGGKAEQIFLRGFDADHGTDINISVDGIPVNMVSHGHGQGYADLHFLMPEVLKGMEVYKGPYYAQFGDFGTAGTVTFNTIDNVEQNTLSAEAGSFGMQRYVGLAELPLNMTNTRSFVSGELLRNKSYFDNPQNFSRYNFFGKVRHELSTSRSLTVWLSGFSSQWDASGQIPERAVENRLISRFGSIDPTEGGTTARYNVNASYSALADASNLLIQTYFSRYRFRLYSDFTFFKNVPVNVDEIKKVDDRSIAGGRVEYSFEDRPFGLTGTTIVGVTYRTDGTNLELWHDARRQRLENRVLAHVRQHNASAFAQHDFRFNEVVQLQLGLRGDYFVFEVQDLNPSSAVLTTSGQVSQFLLCPKANLTVSPYSGLDLFANFGMGFHSNDARGVVAQRGNSTLPRASGAEVGTRVLPSHRFTFSAALWVLDLEREFVYSGDEGTTEESGATRRLGIDVETRAQLLDWLWADVDVTVSRGRFKNLSENQNYIPLAPTFTSTGGITVRHPNGIEGSVRYRHVGSRPANEDNSIRALGYTVFDGTFAYRLGDYKLMVIAENVFNVEWNEAQFATESQLRGEPTPVSELHFTPGSPRSVRLKIEMAW